jgi:molybdopterin-synthase adenylyltransferase
VPAASEPRLRSTWRAAGVGTIGIVDADEVELSNLQRQVIHGTSDIGKPKVESAAETLHDINPGVKVVTYREFVDSSNIADLIARTMTS